MPKQILNMDELKDIAALDYFHGYIKLEGQQKETLVIYYEPGLGLFDIETDKEPFNIEDITEDQLATKTDIIKAIESGVMFAFDTDNIL